jgi:hypothetical protein
LFAKDFPRWTDDWGTKEVTLMKRTLSSSDPKSQAGAPKSGLGVNCVGDVEPNGVFREWPIGTKAAKDVQWEAKIRKGTTYAQAKAIEVMARGTMKKATLLEDYNMLMLMTTLKSQAITSKAHEYLCLS